MATPETFPPARELRDVFLRHGPLDTLSIPFRTSFGFRRQLAPWRMPWTRTDRPDRASECAASSRLGFAALLAILIFLGAESIALLSDLGGSIEVILRENYRSVIACERMKESLERMDSATLFALGGEVDRGRALAAREPARSSRRSCRSSSTTSPSPGRPSWPSACAGSRRVQAGPGRLLRRRARTRTERRRIYFGRLLPVFQQIKGTADRDPAAQPAQHGGGRRPRRGLAGDAGPPDDASARPRHGAGRALGLPALALHPAPSRRPDARRPRDRGGQPGRLRAGDLARRARPASPPPSTPWPAACASCGAATRPACCAPARSRSRPSTSSPEAVAVFSESGEVELVNATAAAVLGLRPGEPLPPRHDWIAERLSAEVRRLERDGEERIFCRARSPRWARGTGCWARC